MVVKKCQSLGHSDKRVAKHERNEKELELSNYAELPTRMKLSELLEDYLERTRSQIEPSTAKAATYCMRDFIIAVGDIHPHKACP